MYDAALRMVDAELRFLWDSLTANEQRVLAALAAGFSPYPREAKLFLGIANRSSAACAVDALEARAIIERTEGEVPQIIDPLLSTWVRRRGATRLQLYVIPHAGYWAVTDGPSPASIRSTHESLDDAQAEAEILAGGGRGADLMIFDTDDPNDLPDWAVGVR